jgi:hypothetical protein
MSFVTFFPECHSGDGRNPKNRKQSSAAKAAAFALSCSALGLLLICVLDLGS